MSMVPITSGKLSVVFKAGNLPAVNPADPQFTLVLNGAFIAVRVSSKAARKLATHQGGVVLQGKLVASSDGNLSLLDAGFNWLDAKPATEPEKSHVDVIPCQAADWTMSSTGKPS